MDGKKKRPGFHHPAAEGHCDASRKAHATLNLWRLVEPVPRRAIGQRHGNEQLPQKAGRRREEENSLCAVLHLKGSRHTGTRARGTSTGRLEAVDLLQVTRGALAGRQLQPRHGRLALLACRRACGGGGRGGLCARGRAQLSVGGVEVEEGGGGVGEVVVAADGVVARCQGFGGGGREKVGQVVGRLGEVECEGHAGEHVEQVRVGGCDAGGVEEGGDGADCAGSCGLVGGVTGVVLSAAANGDVLEGQTRGDTWESCGCCLFLLVSLNRPNNERD